MQQIHQFLLGLKARLSPGEYHPRSVITAGFGGYFLVGHQGVSGMVGVAERTPEIASGEAYKNRRNTGMEPFAL